MIRTPPNGRREAADRPVQERAGGHLTRTGQRLVVADTTSFAVVFPCLLEAITLNRPAVR